MKITFIIEHQVKLLLQMADYFRNSACKFDRMFRTIIIIIFVWMDVAVSTSDLHPEGSDMENTSAEMSPVACQANAGK